MLLNDEDIPTYEFDYNLLKNALVRFRHPRVKINQLLKNGKIVRIKKGLYIRSTTNFSPQVLANMIYGPSYVSSDYALAAYSLIPERVKVVTSMTLGRQKGFSTPVGTFTFEHLPKHLYEHGIKRIEIEGGRAYLVATPEKALVDRLWRLKDIVTKREVSDYLEHDLRLDLSASSGIKVAKIQSLAKIYDRPIIWSLVEVFKDRANYE